VPRRLLVDVLTGAIGGFVAYCVAVAVFVVMETLTVMGLLGPANVETWRRLLQVLTAVIGGLGGAIFGSCIGAWLRQGLTGQRGCAWALICAVVGSVVITRLLLGLFELGPRDEYVFSVKALAVWPMAGAILGPLVDGLLIMLRR
jgi:hypothetical protein